MNKLDFSTFHFSHSSLSTFETCKYSFKLTYLDRVPRLGNFFSDYGSAIHNVLEKYFSGELEIYELMDYYKQEFDNQVVNPPPSFLNIYDSYYQSGLKFFENFDFDRSEYQIINVEEYVKGTDRGINLVIKPDLILTKIGTSDIILLDFKTSEIVSKNGKIDNKKLEGYKKQLTLYVYYIWLFKNIEIKTCKLWFIRSNTWYEWEYNQDDITEVIEWMDSVVNKIRDETEWQYDNSNKFFCQQLCSVSASCKYKPK